jgi:hypothetical protein
MKWKIALVLLFSCRTFCFDENLTPPQRELLSHILEKGGTAASAANRVYVAEHFEISRQAINNLLEDERIKHVLVLGAGYGFDLPLEELTAMIAANRIESLTIVDGYVTKTRQDIAEWLQKFPGINEEKIKIIQADFSGYFRFFVEKENDICDALLDYFTDKEENKVRNYFIENRAPLSLPAINDGALIISSLVLSQMPLVLMRYERDLELFQSNDFLKILEIVYCRLLLAKHKIDDVEKWINNCGKIFREIAAEGHINAIATSGAYKVYLADTFRTIVEAHTNRDQNGFLNDSQNLENIKNLFNKNQYAGLKLRGKDNLGFWSYGGFAAEGYIFSAE